MGDSMLSEELGLLGPGNFVCFRKFTPWRGVDWSLASRDQNSSCSRTNHSARAHDGRRVQKTFKK